MQAEAGDTLLLQEVVNSWIEAFNGHNVAAIVALYTKDAELFDAGMKQSRRGHTQIEHWFTQRFSSMPAITYTPTIQLFAAEHAVVIWTVRGLTPAILGLAWLARPFEQEGVSIFTFRQGRIAKQRAYYDHLSALEQILPLLKWLPWRL